MIMKVLFFDTSALLKLFFTEPGTETIKWLCNANTKVLYGLHFVINVQVTNEFSDKVDTFVKYGKLSPEGGVQVKAKFDTYYKGKMFRVIGQQLISNTKLETTREKVEQDLSLTRGKNDWDGLHYQSMVNALAWLGGKSHPILVTADRKFANKVEHQGYRVINVLKTSQRDIEKIIA